MTQETIKKFFSSKNDTPCPLTEDLINRGYRQKRGGYIAFAKEQGLSNPTQHWHLIESWANRSNPNSKFNKRIQCGELIFWMAEVSNAVDRDILRDLMYEITVNINNRRGGNKKIKDVCFDKIRYKVLGL